MLKIKDVHANIEEKEILKGLNLELQDGKVHALMGPNGSGKSTLAQVLMGHPGYTVTKGTVKFNGENLLDMEPNERAQKGVFLSFQYPSEIPGVSITNFLRMIYNKKTGERLIPSRFRKLLIEKMDLLEMDHAFMERYLNEGYSGGEKKRMEMLQMLILEPKLAILDETDSGLDIDALKVVAKAVNYLNKEKNMTVLIITHYARILSYVSPDKVFILQNGKITKEGDVSLAHELEKSGYAMFGEQE